MKRFILISVLFAITAMAWAQQPAIGKCESKEGFTFFQVTDPQLGFHSKDKNLQWTIDNLKAMVSIINREHPAFVIITGDMIHRHYKKNQVEAYRSVIATVDKDIPVFHIPGNHDMPKYADAPRKQYLDNFGYERFSFEYGGYGFIGINSNALVCDTLPAYIDAAEQLEWMYGELKKYDHLKGTFVFAHHPPVLAKGSPVKHKSEWNEPYRTQYVRLMKQHGVKGIFAGHTHYGETTEIDGIPVFTTVASSYPLYG
ncbi:MAG: metallophosphoesterase, partial [Sodaliphilus sp.]|nr:metallophosphoesterase [Sodaliphilus sp.]